MMMVADSDLKFHVIAGADLGTVEKNVINSELGLIARWKDLQNIIRKDRERSVSRISSIGQEKERRSSMCVVLNNKAQVGKRSSVHSLAAFTLMR